MQVIAARDMLPHIRHLAGKALPGARSSHVAEALAAGFGHASNASLLAWLAQLPPGDPPQLSFSASASARRLGELHAGTDGAEAAFLAAAEESGALVTGHPLDMLAQELASVTSQDAGSWEALNGRLRLARAALLLGSCMEKPTGGGADFVESNAGAGELDLHLRLAACAQQKRDLDRLAADFLAEFLLAADAEAGSSGAAEALAWGDSIYRAYRPRLRAFLDMACRTWPSGLDPLSTAPSPQILKRLGRPPVIVEGRSARDHEFGLADTGQADPGTDVLVGVCCMALLKAGENKREISALAGIRLSGRRAIEACLSRVALAGCAGMEDGASRLVAMLAAAPEDMA